MNSYKYNIQAIKNNSPTYKKNHLLLGTAQQNAK
jgi:hypothetical protein